MRKQDFPFAMVGTIGVPDCISYKCKRRVVDGGLMHYHGAAPDHPGH